MPLLPARYWRLALEAAVVLSLCAMLITRTHQRDAAQTGLERTQAAFDKTVGDYRLAAEKARADDLANARTVETRNAAIAEDTQRDLQTKLASARADADRYASRLRSASAAYPGRGDNSDLSRPASPASGIAGAGTAPDLANDLRICSVNTVKLEAWGDWWRQVSAP